MSDVVERLITDAREATGDIMQAAHFAVSEIGVLRREDLEIALASELIAKAAEIVRLRAEVAQMEQATDTLSRIARARADAVTWLEAEVVALRADLAMTREREGATGLEYRGG